jgi:ribosomal protein S18 acetylase RimI-like enzyme
MDTIRLQAASIEDGPAIANIHATSWRDAYASVLDEQFLSGPIETDRLHYWNDRLDDPADKQIVVVARDAAQRSVGFVCAIPDFDAKLGTKIDHLHVLPDMRGRGIGERLLREAADQARERARSRSVYLWVYEANTRAIGFYLRLGGQVIGREASRIPAAHGKPVLCVHWPDVSQLTNS